MRRALVIVEPRIKRETISLTVSNILLAVSAAATIAFTAYVTTMVQEYIWHGLEYAPQTYGAVLALIVCGYVWVKAQTTYQRYIAAVLMSAILVGFIVWLIGRLGFAGNWIVNRG
jgi:uncharacterized membrane protein YoaT (DUF817 family)